MALGKQSNEGFVTIIFFIEKDAKMLFTFLCFSVRTIYFHALASNSEYSVSNIVLQNETRALSEESYYDYSIVGNRGLDTQSTTSFYDEESNVLFYTLVNKDAIGCWNLNKPFNPHTQGIISMDSYVLDYPNDLKIDRNGYLWVLADRMPAYIYNKLNPLEFNFHILKGKISDLVAGTPCEPELSYRYETDHGYETDHVSYDFPYSHSYFYDFFKK